MAKTKISPELLQKIKDSVNIIDVVGEHVVLRKSGSNHTGLCPFHNERSPSFSVSEQKQLYHCYGCQKGGDLVSFVMEMHGLSFPEAVEELAERGKVALPKDFAGGADDSDPEAAKRRNAQREKTATAYKLNRFAATFFRGQLESQKHIAQYFKSRGLTAELAQNFYVGAAPASWDALATFLTNAKAPMSLASELGLVKPSQKGGRPGGPGYFDLFRNRAIFPILDLRGKVVGFGGRGLPLPPGAPDVGDGTPKYLNSSESPLFQKSKLLYGLFQAQRFIREKDEAILVEGYFDVIGLHGGGFQNVVATCGTSLTPDHLNLLKKFCTKITMLFDGDKAGIAATDRAMETGLQNGLILHGAVMPAGLDPDEVLFDQETGKLKPDGREKMLTILAGTRPLLDVRIEAAFQHSLKGDESRTQAVKQVAEWLAMYADPIGREVRIESVTKQFQISRDLLLRAMDAKKPAFSRNRDAGGAPKTGVKIGVGGNLSGLARGSETSQRLNASRQKLSRRESVLVTGVSRGGQFLAIVKEALHYLPPAQSLLDLVQHPDVRQILDAALSRGATGAELLGSVEDSQVRAVVSEALVSGPDGDGETTKMLSEADFKHAVQKGLAETWARFSQELKLRLRDAELKKDAKLHADLMKEYLDVQRRMKEFGTFYDEA